MTEQQAIEALHALPRLPRSGASLAAYAGSCWTTLETRKSSLSASILRAPTAREPLPL